jgi:hypothetical protein
MARFERLSYKQSVKAKITSRIRQLFVLVLTVIIGLLISVTVNAQDSFQKKKHDTLKQNSELKARLTPKAAISWQKNDL